MRTREGPRARSSFAVALVLWSGAASGESTKAPVDLFVAGTPATRLLLQSSVGLTDRPLRWLPVDRIDETEVLRRPHDVAATAPRVWIDFLRPDRIRMVFANWDTERFLVREIPLPDGWNELAQETIAQVIETSLSALLSNESIGLSQAELSAVLGPRAPVRVDDAPVWRATWGVFYAVQAFAPEQWVEQGPGVAAAFGRRDGIWRPGAWVSAQAQLPVSMTADLIGVRLETLALRAGIEVTRALPRHAALAMQLGGGGDIVHLAPHQGSTTHAALSGDRLSWEYEAQVALAATFRPSTRFELRAAVLADADLGRRHYDVVVNGLAVRAFTPFWVRPGLLLGVIWP